MSTINNTDLFIVSRSGTNYQVDGSSVAAFAVSSGLPSQSGNAGLFLTTDGTTLSWAAAGGGGGVTSFAGGTTGLTPAAASTGAVVLGGTLGIANGGTGQTTSQGAIDALLPSQGGNAGKYLTTDGTNTAWSAAPLNGPASLAEAAAGTITDKYSSPQTAVPKDASGMTGAALIPGGDDGERPGTPAIGMLRYNDQGGTPVDLEYYDGSAWTQLATGGGGGSGTIFAWAFVDHNPPAAPVIIASGNIASVTSSIPGAYGLMFTNAAPSTNYTVVAMADAGNYIMAGRYSTVNNFALQSYTGSIPGNTNGFNVIVVL